MRSSRWRGPDIATSPGATRSKKLTAKPQTAPSSAAIGKWATKIIGATIPA
jgi:hypothetical protein